MSGRLPESVRFMILEASPGSVFPDTVRAPASAPPSDQWLPPVASASTLSSNVTVIVSCDTALADSITGGTMSADVSTLRPVKLARRFDAASRMEPEVLA